MLVQEDLQPNHGVLIRHRLPGRTGVTLGWRCRRARWLRWRVQTQRRGL